MSTRLIIKPHKVEISIDTLMAVVDLSLPATMVSVAAVTVTAERNRERNESQTAYSLSVTKYIKVERKAIYQGVGS